MGRVIGMNGIARPGEQIIFLAGPHRGAELRWREEVVQAIVRRTEAGIAFTDHFSKVKLHPEFSEPMHWGTYHRDAAMENGIVAFWFSKQRARIPGKNFLDPDHQYAANAKHDLGVCLRDRVYRPTTRIIVGCEEGYAKRTMLADRLRLEKSGLTLFVGELDDFHEQILVGLHKLGA